MAHFLPIEKNMKKILILGSFICSSLWAQEAPITDSDSPAATLAKIEVPSEDTEATEESAQAEPPSPWTHSLMAGYYLNQAKTSDNWSAGEASMFSWVARVFGKTQWQNENWSWFWLTDLEYGETQNNDEPMIKFADRLLTEMVGARKITSVINTYVGLKFESQFASGFSKAEDDDGNKLERTKISYFMNPGFFTQSVGLGYDPNSYFSQRVGFAVKETFASEYRRKFADNPKTDNIETFRVEPGMELITEANYNFNEMVKWNGILRMFANFESVESTDIQLDNVVAASIAKYVELNFTYAHLYDIDLDKSLQTNQTFSLGLTWNIF